MPDIYSKKKRSEIMSLIRSKNTTQEKEIFSYLKQKGMRFHKHYDKVVGKPDVALPDKRRAVFIDGDFWHGWHFSRWSSKVPEFWERKIAANIARDRRNFGKLRSQGWTILRVWSHDLTGDRKEATLERVTRFLVKRNTRRRS